MFKCKHIFHFVFVNFSGNVFIHRNPRLLQSPESGLESCEEDDEFEEAVIYKIGKTGPNYLVV